MILLAYSSLNIKLVAGDPQKTLPNTVRQSADVRALVHTVRRSAYDSTYHAHCAAKRQLQYIHYTLCGEAPTTVTTLQYTPSRAHCAAKRLLQYLPCTLCGEAPTTPGTAAHHPQREIQLHRPSTATNRRNTAPGTAAHHPQREIQLHRPFTVKYSSTSPWTAATSCGTV